MKRKLFRKDINKGDSSTDIKQVDDKASEQNTVVMYLHDLVYLLVGIMLVLLLVIRVVVVDGPSMNSTLVDGDYLLLISNVFYRNPQQGDVIVASKQAFKDGEPIIKRVIATEGQEVDIDFLAGVVYVDGQALNETYTNTPTNLEEGIQFPVIVEEGCVFAMGDNRNKSKDSRSPEIGQIDCREILGKAVFLIFPGEDLEQGYNRDFRRLGVVAE